MATAASVLQSFRASAQGERTRLGWRDNFITLLTATWLMIGLFVDGWAHNNIAQLETFFTPWHALFYSGFLACALWTGFLLLREWRAGKRGIAVIPQGYHLGVIGVALFGVGGAGDMTWHVIFGIEQNIDALLSPTHLLLFLGGTLIFGSPFLAAWLSTDPAENAPRFGAFLPALGSLTMMTSFVSFMHMYMWALLRNFHTQTFAGSIATRYPGALRPIRDFSQIAGLEGILLTNVILLAPVLLMVRRWRIPFGSVTFLFVINTIMMSALREFRAGEVMALMLIVGLIADGLVQALKPWNGRAASFRAVAALIPLALWSGFFGVALFGAGVAWSPELTAGVTVMAAISGFGLSLLMAPPAIPPRVEAR